MNARALVILIVDDVPDSAESMALLLRLYGHEIHVAHSCAAALAVVQSCSPDVILMDLGMPDLDGYETAKRLRVTLGTNPIFVAVTGYGQEHYRERSRQEGFDRHFLKPVDPVELADYLLECAARLA